MDICYIFVRNSLDFDFFVVVLVVIFFSRYVFLFLLFVFRDYKERGFDNFGVFFYGSVLKFLAILA